MLRNRSTQLHRLTLDCKDFDVGGCPAVGASAGVRTSAAPATTVDGNDHCGQTQTLNCPHQPRWMCIGKHLCGAATDFALRACLSRINGFRSGSLAAKPDDSCRDGEGNSNDDGVDGTFDGLAIAPCCHHRRVSAVLVCIFNIHSSRVLLQSSMAILACPFAWVWVRG